MPTVLTQLSPHDNSASQICCSCPMSADAGCRKSGCTSSESCTSGFPWYPPTESFFPLGQCPSPTTGERTCIIHTFEKQGILITCISVVHSLPFVCTVNRTSLCSSQEIRWRCRYDQHVERHTTTRRIKLHTLYL